jgi:hypothetical protein
MRAASGALHRSILIGCGVFVYDNNRLLGSGNVPGSVRYSGCPRYAGLTPSLKMLLTCPNAGESGSCDLHHSAINSVTIATSIHQVITFLRYNPRHWGFTAAKSIAAISRRNNKCHANRRRLLGLITPVSGRSFAIPRAYRPRGRPFVAPDPAELVPKFISDLRPKSILPVFTVFCTIPTSRSPSDGCGIDQIAAPVAFFR